MLDAQVSSAHNVLDFRCGTTPKRLNLKRNIADPFVLAGIMTEKILRSATRRASYVFRAARCVACSRAGRDSILSLSVLRDVQVREINKYTLQDAQEEEGVPRVGLYILQASARLLICKACVASHITLQKFSTQDERCWELLPPEEELDMWIAKLQLAVFGQVQFTMNDYSHCCSILTWHSARSAACVPRQEVIAHEYATAERAQDARSRVRDLKGAHYLTLQQQCVVLPPPPRHRRAVLFSLHPSLLFSPPAARLFVRALVFGQVWLDACNLQGSWSCYGAIIAPCICRWSSQCLCPAP